ncbi:MAG: sugar ABC transporter permease, partial [Anaerolineae bacterium]
MELPESRGGGSAAASHPTSGLQRRRSWWRGDTGTAILMLLPSVAAVAIFIYGFIVWTGFISLVDWNTVVENYRWVGLDNWRRLFALERFGWNMRNLVIYGVGFMGQSIVIGFILAVLLNQNIKAESIFRTIIILPFAVSAIVTGVAWRWLMQPTTGLNVLIQRLGAEGFRFAWVS